MLVARVALFGVLVGATAGPAAATAATADGPSMEARVLLEGHARIGSWLAIEVRLANEGVPVTGELRLQGGAQGGTRFSVPVDLPSPSDKTYLLHAQPPSFGQQLEVLLVAANDAVVARQKVAFTVHDASQLTVGVVAAQAQGIVAGIQLPGGQDQNGGQNLAPVIIPLDPTDLPERIEAWSALDRLIWQDVDTNTLSTRQIAALRGWLALGGRLVIVGGTAGPGVLSGFPDEILPYRPSTTIDVAPESLTSLLGQLPEAATDVPALAGELTRGRSLASSGDRVVAAEAEYGSGSVTVLGIDPTVGWIAESKATVPLWRTLIPPRASAQIGMGDDSQIVGAVSELPALALAADRRAADPAARLHRPDRPRQLPDPSTPRSSRVGMADDAGPDRDLRRGSVRLRIGPSRQRCHRQRGRHRPRRPGRNRGLGPGVPRRLFADQGHVPAVTPRRRPAVGTDRR